MLALITNDLKRLKGLSPMPADITDKPFSVDVYASKTSRSPRGTRCKTLEEALFQVTVITGSDNLRYVKTWDDFSLHAFTGKHEERYKDVKQYSSVDPKRIL